MAVDPRGVKINRDDLVAWFGKIPGERTMLRLGVVEAFGWFGTVWVSEILHGPDGEWYVTDFAASVRSRKVMVIADAPESPHE